MEKHVMTHHGGHLEALLNGCPDAILAINADGIVIFANKEACALTERTMTELIGRSIVEVYENVDAARDANRKIYEAGGTIHNLETFTKTKSGKLVPVRVSASHLYDSNGKYIGGVGYFAQYRPWSGAEAHTKARLEHMEAEMERLKSLASPIFELYPGLSVMVVVGEIDSDRLKDISSVLLRYMEKMRAQVALVDLSNATVINNDDVARQLARTVRTIRLLGAECIVAVMPANLAQAMEPVLAELGSLKSFNCINTALEEALKIIGYEIRKK